MASMAGFRKTIRSIFVWSYERGTIQYDIICALILAFIFLVPPSCFVSKKNGAPKIPAKSSRTVPQGAPAESPR
jgi:hypothetical protein